MQRVRRNELTMKLKIIIIGAMRTLADLKPSETGHIRAITGTKELPMKATLA
jgi:hypothetical protein